MITEKSKLVLSFCRVDVVLISGDFANVPLECYANGGPLEVFQEHHCHFKKLLKEFTFVCSRIYYIPGNVGVWSL